MDDKLHGKGIMTSKDGYKFEGWYKDGKRDGDGEMTLPNGTTIRGKWVNDVRVRNPNSKKKKKKPPAEPASKGKADADVNAALQSGKENPAADDEAAEEPSCGCVIS